MFWNLSQKVVEFLELTGPSGRSFQIAIERRGTSGRLLDQRSNQPQEFFSGPLPAAMRKACTSNGTRSRLNKSERQCEKEAERERAHNKMHGQPPSAQPTTSALI